MKVKSSTPPMESMWDIIDFNKIIPVITNHVLLQKWLLLQINIAVIGRQNDGETILIFSTQGKVWTERNHKLHR